MKDNIFTEKEFNLLLSVANEYINIINSDKVDNTSLRQQNDAWQNITLKFNEKIGNNITRSEEQLQSFWEQYICTKIHNEIKLNEQADEAQCEDPELNELCHIKYELEEESNQCSFHEEYERKKRELIHLEIEKLKDEIDHQRILLNLKEIKHKLERELVILKETKENKNASDLT